jgi:ribosomal-protein-alanine N-acetyltransferase
MKEMTRVELRRLQMRDLNAVEEIERRSYPTPWSRSMFASELAKPSSICLGAFDAESGRLVGYLIISRYVDAWHVMNVAVAPGHRRRGIGTTLLEELIAEADAGGKATSIHVERNNPALSLYSRLGFEPREDEEPGIYLRMVRPPPSR